MMRKTVTVADMRRLEAQAVANGLSYTALMERAGLAVADRFCEKVSPSVCHRVLVLCGNGNNGGDGFVIARLLCDRGYAVTVLLMSGDPVTSLAMEMKERLDTASVALLTLPQEPQCLESFFDQPAITEASHIVDAVYGIGFHGSLPTVHKEVFRRLAAMHRPVLAVDIPSGMNADDGLYDKDLLCADETVTFTALKPAALMPDAPKQFGRITVADVGISEDLIESLSTPTAFVEAETVKAVFIPRPADGHKGTFGSVLAVCGSYGMAGAALLAGKAALRCGVGLMHMALPRSIYPIAAGQLWEAVYHPLEETQNGCLSLKALSALLALGCKMQAVVIGCGLSQDKETAALLKEFLPTLTAPTVIDADGLNHLSKHIDVLKAMKAPLVLTPHPAEMSRLLGCTVKDVQRDRIGAAKTLASLAKAVVVLKGHRTVIASPEGDVYINMTGCSGMATGGSGDVLSGMIASFAAQGMTVLQAAVCGVYLHGLAGEAASARLSETAMLPTDMLDELGGLLSHFEKRE